MSYASRKVLKALRKFGFEVLREGGSHTIMRRVSDGVQIAVPRHPQIKRGTARSIADDAGVTWSAFRKEVS